MLLRGQTNPEQPEDVNVLSSAQSAPRWLQLQIQVRWQHQKTKSSNNFWVSIEMSLLAMIEKLVAPTELSFTSIPWPRSMLLLAAANFPLSTFWGWSADHEHGTTGYYWAFQFSLFCTCFTCAYRRWLIPFLFRLLALNDATVIEIFPLPSVHECLDSLLGSSRFTTLDLYSGYWQIPIAKGLRHKTAFLTESGHWQFWVMPQLSLRTSWQISWMACSRTELLYT